MRFKPFYNATQEKVSFLEADIFFVNDTLFVAHTKKEIKSDNTLQKLYLEPIKQFSASKKFYSFNVLIDVKEGWDITSPALLKLLDQYKTYFTTSKAKVKIIITGSRPADSTFRNYPDYILFDGLPTEKYQKKDLAKVAMISTSFKKFSKWKGTGEVSEQDRQNLAVIINNAHLLNKPIRFWSAPDNEEAWSFLHKLGADVINTDHIKECVQYFKSINEFQR